MSHQTLQHVLPESALSRLLPKPLLPEPSQSKVFPELAKQPQPKTFEHRLLLFLLTERGLNEDFLTSVCEHCEILGWFAPDFHIELNSDLLSLTTLGNVKRVVS
jgi:hypothetical protein